MQYLKKTFRWFGPSFGVTLDDIKQLGVEGIVTACSQVPIGEVWSLDHIASIKVEIEANGMEWSVVESVNIHNAIKYGLPERDGFIDNYIQTLTNLAKNGIHTVCYNFMPLIDWTRTNLNYELPNGAISLLLDPIAIVAFDMFILKRDKTTSVYDSGLKNIAKSYFEGLDADQRIALEKAVLSGMPGSKEPISMVCFSKDLVRVSKINKTELRENLAYFLRAVIPEAEKLGVRMAIHPDDPPFSVFGIPRIASTYEDLNFVVNCFPSPYNGLTFCSGSLGASPDNNLLRIIRDFGSKIHFIHLRNICRDDNGLFYEASHLNGSIPMAKVMVEIIKEQRRRSTKGNQDVAIPIRPDHGHILLDDKQRKDKFYPGYSLIGRAIGMAELHGLEKGIREVL